LNEAKALISKLTNDLEDSRILTASVTLLNERLTNDLAEARNFIEKLTKYLPGPSVNLGEVTEQQYKKCRFCNKNFKKTELGLHLLLAHKDGAPTSSGGQGESSSSTGTLGKKRSASLSPSKKCLPCDTTITTKNFKQHIRSPKHKKRARLEGDTGEAGGSSSKEDK
uniref:C2H2-type domain-containing protein n=1 Tax=Meloidogyne javanica TaxID=6303 RepID=A0A915M571_MELJA